MPAIRDLTILPGETSQFNIKLVNEEKVPLTVAIDSAGVKFNPEGTPQVESPEQVSPDSVVWWTQLDRGPYKLMPGEVHEVPVTVHVPREAAPGGHYGAILASDVTPAGSASGTAVQLQAKLGTLLLVDVGGESRKEFRINRFLTGQSIYKGLPVDLNLVIENPGNTHLQVHGVVEITNQWTGEKQGKVLVNPDFTYLFPGKTHEEILSWGHLNSGIMPMGQYKARMVLRADGAGERAAEVTFWVIPAKIMAAGGGILLVVIAVLAGYRWMLIRQIKKKNG